MLEYPDYFIPVSTFFDLYISFLIRTKRSLSINRHSTTIADNRLRYQSKSIKKRVLSSINIYFRHKSTMIDLSIVIDYYRLTTPGKEQLVPLIPLTPITGSCLNDVSDFSNRKGYERRECRENLNSRQST